MFRTKICGVRLTKDLQAVEQAGGDAVGFNFFPASIRYLDPSNQATRELSLTAQSLGLIRVGVFVNESTAAIRSVMESVGFDLVQLHGDETMELGRELRRLGIPVIRAIKLPRTEFASELLSERSRDWVAIGCHLLLDADAGTAHGGSGKTLDWPSVARWANIQPGARWTLAGGLTPENVRQAILATGALSVDTASGVECPKGVKNGERIGAFLAAAGL